MPNDQPAHQAAPNGLLIPVVVPTIDDLIKEFEAAISNSGCHFYIDTSFLIWLTQIGKAARAEFKSWINAVGPNRFHVPVWAGHEFLTHHVHDLIGKKLSEVTSDLRTTADDTYLEIRPFLDEPLDERGPKALQLFARDTLLQLKRLASNVAKWKEKHYRDHFNEVVGLITTLGLKHRPSVLEFLTDIDILEKTGMMDASHPDSKTEKSAPNPLTRPQQSHPQPRL